MLIPCPVCARQVSVQAHACPGCGAPIAAAAVPPAAVPAEPQPVFAASPPVTEPTAQPTVLAAPPETVAVYGYAARPDARDGRAALSNVQPVWQYLLLQVCSFGIYDLFWFYNTWSLLKERHRLYISPGARAIFRYFFAIHLSREIYKLEKEAEVQPDWNPVGIGLAYIILDFLAGACMRQDAAMPFVWGMVFFALSIGVRLPLVNALNAFWRREQPDRPERSRLSGRAWVVVIFGSLFWVAVILGLFADKGGSTPGY